MIKTKKRISVFTLSVFLLSLILGSMLAANVSADGTVLYESKFGEWSSLADANLIYDQGEIASVKFENGALVLDNRENTDQDVFLKFSPAVKLPDGVDQFTVSWQHTYLEDTGPSRYLAMNFFYNDTDNYSGLWHRCESNLFTVDVKSGGSFTHYEDLGEFNADDFGIAAGANVKHDYKIVYDKGVVTAYVDGVKMGTGKNDAEVASGEFGFMVKVECGVILENLIIYTGVGDPVYPGGAIAADDPSVIHEVSDDKVPAADDGAAAVVDVPRSTRTGDASTVFIILGIVSFAALLIMFKFRKRNRIK